MVTSKSKLVRLGAFICLVAGVPVFTLGLVIVISGAAVDTVPVPSWPMWLLIWFAAFFGIIMSQFAGYYLGTVITQIVLKYRISKADQQLTHYRSLQKELAQDADSFVARLKALGFKFDP